MSGVSMIRKLTNTNIKEIITVINEAATAYKGKIPADRWKEPYMDIQEINEEFQSGVQFYGYVEKNNLVAVMGIQPVKDVTLIRHAYTLTSQQRKGIGEKLLEHLLILAQTERILVGTWETALWAVKFYEKNGFRLLSRENTNKMLKKYWTIPKLQVATSVALEYKRNLQ
jgi:GNAT superfamily N-acetyltransferase